MGNVFFQIMILFIIIFIGYICKKTNILDNISDQKISRFIVNIAIPCTIFNSIKNLNNTSSNSILITISIAISVFVIIPFLSAILVRLAHWNRVYNLLLDYSNLGFMGIPIITSIFGDEYTFHVAIFMMIFNISIFSYGVYVLIDGRQLSVKSMLKKLLNPGIVSSFIALIMFFLHLHFPDLLSQCISQISLVTTPMAMIIIGSTLANVSFRDTFTDINLFIFSFIKLVVYPILIWFIFRLFIHDTNLLALSIILTGLPTGANVSMLCNEYQVEVDTVASGIFISTVLSLISIPVMLLLIKYFII
ncbi:MAG: AEC family transporter [Lachnospiraceae bacterium]